MPATRRKQQDAEVCMQELQVFSATSLSEVIEQLAFFRPSGLLTIRRAAEPHQDEASIVVEDGRPLRIRWGGYRADINEYILQQLTLWGEIHFVFRVREPLRQLPSPSQLSHEVQPRSPAPVTQPLPALDSSLRRTHPGRVHLLPDAREGTQSNPLPQVRRTRPSLASKHPSIATELAIPTLTEKAKGYPMMDVPRYDRTIFLLIDGRRTIADLSRLTRRSLSAVRASLSRLRDQQLVEVPAC
ncbi:MAG TPA: hypothetical protein VF043_10585 [Ktedonobacteraceae bacterium]